jgi:hypothetical protein
MAERDIMPFNAPAGGWNRMESYEVDNTQAGALGAGATFLPGEVVVVTGALGEVLELAASTSDNADHTVLIAAQGATTAANIRRIGDARYSAGPNVDARFPVSCWPTTDAEMSFQTRNGYAAGSDVNIGPAGSNLMTGLTIGAVVGLRRDAGGNHGLVVGGLGLVITRLLDAQNRDTYTTGNATDRIIFRPINTIDT